MSKSSETSFCLFKFLCCFVALLTLLVVERSVFAEIEFFTGLVCVACKAMIMRWFVLFAAPAGLSLVVDKMPAAGFGGLAAFAITQPELTFADGFASGELIELVAWIY